MGQDREVGQGPNAQLIDERKRAFAALLASDIRNERQLAWKELLALFLASELALLFHRWAALL